MKSFTVKLFPIINAASPIPTDMVECGIDAKTKPSDGKIQQMFLGQPDLGYMQFVDNAFMGGAEVVKSKFHDVGLQKAYIGQTEKWFLTKPVGKSHNILVRIIGKTQRDLGLILGGYTDGVEVIATGSGYENSGKEWCDTLVVIPPYAAVMIEKNGKEAFAIVNSGGGFLRQQLEPMPIVITPEEYERNFVTHMKVSETGSTTTGTNENNSPAVASGPGKYLNSPKPEKFAPVNPLPTPTDVVREAEGIFAGMNDHK